MLYLIIFETLFHSSYQLTAYKSLGLGSKNFRRCFSYKVYKAFIYYDSSTYQWRRVVFSYVVQKKSMLPAL